MSDQEINIAIAEACGWTNVECPFSPNDSCKGAQGIPPNKRNNYKPAPACDESDSRSFYWVPRYCNDLNAMHEAEETLTQDQQDEYDYHLSEITAPITGERWPAIHSTARSRAEAFLRTIAKWKEAAK
mgnify:CR=1 FL=1